MCSSIITHVNSDFNYIILCFAFLWYTKEQTASVHSHTTYISLELVCRHINWLPSPSLLLVTSSMENSHQHTSSSPVFVMLPTEAPMPTSRASGSAGRLLSSFPWMYDGPLTPLKVILNQNPVQFDKPLIEFEARLRAASPSIASSTSQEEHLTAFKANIEQSYLRKVIQDGDIVHLRNLPVDNMFFHLQVSTSRSFLSVKQQKSRLWHDTLLMKKDVTEKLLQAQKIIQEIEDEIAEHLMRETIVRLHSRYYKIDDESTSDGQFISAVLAVLIKPSPRVPV